VVEPPATGRAQVNEGAVGGDGCSLIVDSREDSRLASAIRDLNVAVKIHDRCARVSLTRAATDWPLPALDRVVGVFPRFYRPAADAPESLAS